MLDKDKCVPCSKSTPVMTKEEIESAMQELSDQWRVEKGHHLYREYPFKGFKTALAFTNQIGLISEGDGHHPDIGLSWGKVTVTLYTHAIDGLSKNDFILAAKFEAAYGTYI